MKRKFLASAVLAALLSTTALADTSSMNSSVSGMGILENDYVRAGVNGTTGTLGSGGNTSPGLLYDSTGTGTFNTSYDYLTPGSPFDGFSVMVDGTNYTNNNSGGAEITGDGNGLTDGASSLSWTGGVAGSFDITNTYSLGTTSEYIDITSSITMGTAADDVWFGRFIDPDARAADGDSSSTDNVLGYGVIPDSNVAFSEALSSRYALGLYSTDTNVDAGITRWTTDANSYTENAVDGDGSLTNTGDNTIGLSWNWTSVSTGDTLTASYAYIFGPSAFDAADTAITGGAGGGDTTTTDSWGTLEDVGSATDAAEGTAEPTVTDTSSASTTSTATAPSSHTDAEGDTILGGSSHIRADYSERNYIETAMTEMGRTSTYATTTTTTTTTTYSDGTSTAADTTTSGTTTTSETYYHTVTTEIDDILASTTPGESTSVSQGYDSSTYVDTLTLEVSEDRNSLVVTATAERTGEEVYEVTTPTIHTYDRTTTTTTVDDFADSSYYTDTSDTATATSTVSETYDVVTEAREDRIGGRIATIETDINQTVVIDDIQRNLARGTTFGQIQGRGYQHTYGIYEGDTRQIQLGATSETEDGIKLGAGIHISETNLDGNTGNIAMESRQFGATLSKESNGWNLSGTVQHTQSDSKISSTPTLVVENYGTNLDFPSIELPTIPSIGGDVKSSNTSISLLAKGSGETFRPIVGATLGKEEVDSITYSIAGTDVWTTEGKDDTYGYATIGGELTLGIATVTALHHTDGVNQFGVSLDKTHNGIDWTLGAERIMTDEGETTSVKAGVRWKF